MSVATARRLWPEALWIRGQGPYATVRGCGGGTTVLLHNTAREARSALQRIHPLGTRDCSQLHGLVLIEVWPDE